jgi:CubicO group peptidase (beta-lactamase class C family)
MDDPTCSAYLRKPKLSTAAVPAGTDGRLRFTMLANGGSVEGTRLLGRKTVELMTCNHLPGDGEMADFALPMGYGEVGFAGAGFGLTVAVSKGPQATGVVGSAGEFMWGGAASTTFWVDPPSSSRWSS